jgi:hypothetical protein
MVAHYVTRQALKWRQGIGRPLHEESRGIIAVQDTRVSGRSDSAD